MKKIKLGLKGTFALIDDEDFERVSKYKWYDGKTDVLTFRGVKLHRFIMNCPKGLCVDHIDGNILNNQKSNLRICTHAENLRNQKIQSRKKSSIYKGVCWNKQVNKWRTVIRYNQKLMFSGDFNNERHAALAYDLWATELFGEFARTNFKVVAQG